MDTVRARVPVYTSEDRSRLFFDSPQAIHTRQLTRELSYIDTSQKQLSPHRHRHLKTKVLGSRSELRCNLPLELLYRSQGHDILFTMPVGAYI
jgi:hypothetical protein